MENIIKTDVLLDNSGREYDLGRAYYRSANLKVLTKDEAIDAFKRGKRVYFIYENNRIYRTSCRKVCADMDYLKDHYDCYHEVCGVLVREKENSLREITNKEFYNLKEGDVVFVACGDKFYQSKVVKVPFYNADADEPDWEVETSNGFCDQYSLYI